MENTVEVSVGVIAANLPAFGPLIRSTPRARLIEMLSVARRKLFSQDKHGSGTWTSKGEARSQDDLTGYRARILQERGYGLS